MEEYIGYIIVGLGYLVWAGIRAANKNQGNKTSQIGEKDKGNSLQVSGNENPRKKLSVNELIEQFTRIRTENQKSEKPKSEKHWLDMEEEEQEKAFLNRDLETARKSHYSEESLVAEYKRSHAQGKPLPHHYHSIPEVNTGFSDEDTAFDYNKERSHSKKPHHILQIMKDKKRAREAFILKEILDRKF